MNIFGSKTLIVVITAIGVLYPLLVYFSLPKLGVTALALGLLAIAWARFALNNQWRQPKAYLLPGAIALICLLAIVRQDPLYIKFYPAVMNLSVGLIFAYSLTLEKTIIERFAQRFKPEKAAQPQVKRYLRKLTIAWSVLLIANALVAAYTALYSSAEFWALYNCVISYLIMAAFFVLELVFRYFYHQNWRRAYNAPSQKP